jgi:hypothetical protein
MPNGMIMNQIVHQDHPENIGRKNRVIKKDIFKIFDNGRTTKENLRDTQDLFFEFGARKTMAGAAFNAGTDLYFGNEENDDDVVVNVVDVENDEVDEDIVASSSSSKNLMLSINDIRALSPQLDKALGLLLKSNKVSLSGPTKTKHIFSHVIHDISVYTAKIDPSVDKDDLAKELGVSEYRWVTASEMQHLGLSTWALRILDSSDSFREGKDTTDAKGKGGAKKVAKDVKMNSSQNDGFEWMRLRLKG